MAYPGEQEHIEYLNYVEEQILNGNKPLPKGEWRKQIKRKPETQSALQEIITEK